jgi:uncharacterized protein YqjF (DUF2071 family)
MTTRRSVPPRQAAQALDYVRQGGRLVVATPLRVTLIDRKALKRFEKAGAWLLREEGEGYRLRNGKGSVYLLPGQLAYVIDD